MSILFDNLKTNSKQMKKIVLISLVLISFTGCEKNFGDKNMTPELKLILGDWYCESIFVNNLDSTVQLKDSVELWQFYYEPKVDGVSHKLFMRGIAKSLGQFEFKFIDNSKRITIANVLKPQQISDNRWACKELKVWEILGLNENKLKLRSEPIKSNTYEIHFYKN
jgi:hypothetical protein